MKLEDVYDEIAQALAELARLFKPHAKLTFVMRNPELEDGDMFVSDDDPQKVIESIQKTALPEVEPPAKRDTVLVTVWDRSLIAELEQAEAKAWDSLARYKFQMFGYWAAIWVHLNRIGAFGRSNPWRSLVAAARAAGKGK